MLAPPHLMGPCWVAGTIAATAVEAPELPSHATGAASNPEVVFTLATCVDLGREGSSGSLVRHHIVRSCHVAQIRGELSHVGQVMALVGRPGVPGPVESKNQWLVVSQRVEL